MGGTPRRAHKTLYLPFKRVIWSTLWAGGQNPSLDCSWPAPGCFRGRIVREWAQVAKKSARVSTLRGKECETFLPITKKRDGRTIHSTIFVFKGRKKGRAHDTFDKLCLQVPQGGPVMGGTPRRAHKALYLPFKRAIWSTLWAGGQNPSLAQKHSSSERAHC